MNFGNASRVNFGASTGLEFDEPCYVDRLNESTNPMAYRLNPDQIKSCSSCFSGFGPRGSSYGVSTLVGNTVAPKQDLVDLESVLSNRNVPTSRCKNGRVNPVNVTKFASRHAARCNRFLDPLDTHLTNPPRTYRELSINRFYDLPKDPQSVIFVPFARDTIMEAKDNHHERIPQMMDPYAVYPEELVDGEETANCRMTKSCPFPIK